eukprot:TRINITY_DN26205_c2_g1_i1.p1 TRINITY_DN26205_c2_g1~~TRINITY_DN26205_c2_g1_i1.p1  ORF type:complete len:378 (+),score=60.45 TRINITY_DN26205_c2_g1_i1:146-1279(+)
MPSFKGTAYGRLPRHLKIKCLCGCMSMPYAVGLISVLWYWLITPPLGELHQQDLTGKTFVITGATSGLGMWHAQALARWNATLVLPVRDLEKGKEFAQKLREDYPGAPPAVVKQLDLSSFESVRSFVDSYTGPVDVLVHNAATLGVGAGRIKRTEDGFEECLQVNYLSPFLLTSLLLDRIEKSQAGRIVHVSAKAHEWGNVSIDDFRRDKVLDPNYVERQLKMMGNLGGSYADSKLAQVLFSSALTRRLKPNVVSIALHPAVVRTNLLKDVQMGGPDGYVQEWIMEPFGRMVGFMQSEAEAPKTQIHVSTHPALQVAGGRYYSALKPPLTNCGKKVEDCGVAEVSGIASMRWLQEDLWDESCAVLDLKDGMCSRSAQ